LQTTQVQMRLAAKSEFIFLARSHMRYAC